MSENLSARLEVHNDTQRPRVVWVEPVAEDFTLLSGESLEIVARGIQNRQWFGLVELEDATQVYLQEPDFMDFQVFQNGKRLERGHNRDAGRKAGIRSLL